ncbi:scale keratin-like isoform X2 [Polyergus mexicanus]
MPIFGEETQVKKQDKRGILDLSHGGFGGSVLHGDSLAIGADYGQSYLSGASLGHGISAPAYSNSYNAPLYSSHHLDYSGGLGLGHGGSGYASGGLGYGAAGLGGYSATGLGYGAAGLGYGAAGLGYGAAGLGYGSARPGYGTTGFGYNAARLRYNTAGLGYGAGYSTGSTTIGSGYRQG